MSSFLASVYHAMEVLPDLKKDDLLPYLEVLSQVKETGLLERFDVDIIARVQDVKERVRVLGGHWYERRTQELQSAPGVNREARKGAGQAISRPDLATCANGWKSAHHRRSGRAAGGGDSTVVLGGFGDVEEEIV